MFIIPCPYASKALSGSTLWGKSPKHCTNKSTVNRDYKYHVTWVVIRKSFLNYHLWLNFDYLTHSKAKLKGVVITFAQNINCSKISVTTRIRTKTACKESDLLDVYMYNSSPQPKSRAHFSLSYSFSLQLPLSLLIVLRRIHTMLIMIDKVEPG